MKITITGMEGAGKSTVAKLLAKDLGWKFLSMGDFRGEMALERGITIDELNEIGKTDPKVHTEADDFARKWGQEHDDFVLEARLGWWTVPDSFKVFLDVKPEVGAKRVFQDQENRPDEKKADCFAEIMERMEKRRRTWGEGIEKAYGVDWLDMKNYDLALDTSEISAKEVAEKIKEAVFNKR